MTLLLSVPQCMAAGSALLRKGNGAYENGKYGIAFDLYQRAVKKGKTSYGEYNSGAALYRLGDYNGAAKAYLESARKSSLKQDAYFNAGDAFYNTDRAKAIALFRAAYLLNPGDEEALHNLQLAVSEQQNKQKQQQDDKQDKNNNNNEDKQNNQNSKNNKQQEKQDNAAKNNISKEEADSILQMLGQQGNNVLAPTAAQPKQETVDKDW